MTDRTIIELPEPIIRGNVSTRCIEDLLRPRDPAYEDMFAPGQETLGHFYLPPFQRPSAWTETQAARLVESVHLGISIGGIVVSDSGQPERTTLPDGRIVERYKPEADWLIDGQQRLRSLRRYIDNDLVVFRGTTSEHRFEDLTPRQRRRFTNVNLGYTVLEPAPVEELARLYDLLNFGGTAHREDQRASDQATD